MIAFAQLALAGVTMGSVYGLIALGFTLVYNGTRVFNFAQGEFAMLGAMFAGLLVPAVGGYAVALPLIVLLAAVAGVLVERLAVRLLEGRNLPPITFVMATLAVAIIAANTTRALAGTQRRAVPQLFAVDHFRVGGVTLVPQYLAVIAAAALSVALLWLFFNRTATGLAMRATGINRAAANLMGINLRHMTVLSFALSAVVCAVAGALIGPLVSAQPYMGLPLAVKGFIAAILGGISNPFAALTGGLVLGLIESFTAGYVASELTEIITFALLPVILLVRPAGLFGEYEG